MVVKHEMHKGQMEKIECCGLYLVPPTIKHISPFCAELWPLTWCEFSHYKFFK